jgi:hypothetical protein
MCQLVRRCCTPLQITLVITKGSLATTPLYRTYGKIVEDVRSFLLDRIMSSFNMLKEKLVGAPILVFSYQFVEFHVHVDASNIAPRVVIA